jgi:hypothetical protein
MNAFHEMTSLDLYSAVEVEVAVEVKRKFSEGIELNILPKSGDS